MVITMITAKQIAFGNRENPQIKALFQSAFPRWERVPFWALLLRSKSKGIDFFSFFDQEQFCGLAYLVTYANMTFIQYLAVDGAVRSKGYGTQILHQIDERGKGRTIVLEIEAVDAAAGNFEQRKKRKAFYLRNGYASSGYGYSLGGVAFEVLYKGAAFDPQAYSAMLKWFSLGLFRVRLRPIR